MKPIAPRESPSGGELGTETRDVLLGELRRTPRRLAELLRGRPRALLVWTPAPGKPSILEILCTSRAVEGDRWQECYGAISRGEWLSRLDQIACDEVEDARAQRASHVLQEWRRRRRETLALLQGIDASQWQLETERDVAAAPSLESLVRHHIEDDTACVAEIEAVLERHAILGRLAAAPRELARVIEGVPNDVLRRRPPLEPQRWSMLENVCHLRDFEQRVLERYSNIIEQDRPELPPLALDALVQRRHYAQCDPVRMLRELERLRDQSLRLLHALGPRAWQRSGVHTKRGEIRIADLVAQQLDHDAAHLARLRSLRSGLAPAPVAAPTRAPTLAAAAAVTGSALPTTSPARGPTPGPTVARGITPTGERTRSVRR